ncbi:SIR2 family protein [Pseudomonas moraviensis]|uniref:SIR2 family protein n=1 Tax=Pseudomonas moraviensis TaxID=321662 RepID=UPI0010594420|nr:SIR2 family protein [Pseudomonas moraviensis]TDK58000.1 hypothetical protein E1508_03240 [Pseudomonas moraviensis]
MRKRAVVLFGAGASVEYGVASTAALTDVIEEAVLADEWMQHTGGDKAFVLVKETIQGYLQSPKDVQFEQIYHCVHELIYLFGPTKGAVNEFRPLLVPFVDLRGELTERSLRALAAKIVEVIYSNISSSCAKLPISLDPAIAFFEELRSRYITKVYTTNYDDYPLQAAPDLYTGFDVRCSAVPKRFELNEFWNKQDLDSIFHLHGSVHLGFSRPPSGNEIGELFWLDDRAEALKCANFGGSDARRMDGSSFLRTSIVTGLDKLSRLQLRPMSHYYSALALDMMRTDVIFVIGSGLGDLHLNTWLQEARTRSPGVPILFVDYWNGDFRSHFEFDYGRKEIEMMHALRIFVGFHHGYNSCGTAWTLSKSQDAAVWGAGFQNFLNAPDELAEVLARLKV